MNTEYLNNVDGLVTVFEMLQILFVFIIDIRVELVIVSIALLSVVTGLCKIQGQNSENGEGREIADENEELIDKVTKLFVDVDFDYVDHEDKVIYDNQWNVLISMTVMKKALF